VFFFLISVQMSRLNVDASTIFSIKKRIDDYVKFEMGQTQSEIAEHWVRETTTKYKQMLDEGRMHYTLETLSDKVYSDALRRITIMMVQSARYKADLTNIEWPFGDSSSQAGATFTDLVPRGTNERKHKDLELQSR